ncbi:MAG TPA: dihydrodipicolinate synthase family protein [Tepidisphaeraceae bacterium]|jgi:dihydrodipicolinate synthase/N-acetylneuraminate lyase|nr:dihydrodipicolinate synthase family protein [Tepidisphaeraceae bacterium]
MITNLRQHLLAGQVIPAHPLALTESRRLDERRQRALTRYYLAAGAGGIAVGVHTTQFEIRLPQFALLRPVLELASQTVDEELARHPRPFAKVAGVVGETEQAVREAELARSLGYDAVLLSLGKLRNARDEQLVAHCRAVADVMPVIGFYLQPAAGGRLLSHRFWRSFCEIPNVVAIKMAPFNRYQTIDVVRAVADSGREDIALYTGNDDNIVNDLLTPFQFAGRTMRVVGGLLGHWAVWTKRAVEMLAEIHRMSPTDAPSPADISSEWLTRNIAVTDANAAFFDAANNFRGCITGIHEVLRRQGLLAGTWCLNPEEQLSPGQAGEIDRVCRAYPGQNDDAFVAEHLAEWMR